MLAFSYYAIIRDGKEIYVGSRDECENEIKNFPDKYQDAVVVHKHYDS